jgi:predicted RNase H-like HicB family nuclease
MSHMQRRLDDWLNGEYIPSVIALVGIELVECEEGGYTIYVPSLPGCISEGETIEEALRNIQEAIELYLEPVEDNWIASKPL